MRVLSAIMLLGNLEFKDIGGYELDMMGNEGNFFILFTDEDSSGF